MGHIDDKYCAIGDKAITMVIPLLQRVSYTGHVDTIETGSRLVLPLQKAGVDIMVWVSHGEVYCIEVKGEQRHSPNMFIEETARNGKQGWVHTLRCDLLAYVFISSRVAHLIKLEPFLLWYWVFGDTYKRKQAISTTGVVSTGTIIPWADIKAELYNNQYQCFNLDDNSTWDNQLYDMGLNRGTGGFGINCNNTTLAWGNNDTYGCRAN